MGTPNRKEFVINGAQYTIIESTPDKTFPIGIKLLGYISILSGLTKFAGQGVEVNSAEVMTEISKVFREIDADKATDLINSLVKLSLKNGRPIKGLADFQDDNFKPDLVAAVKVAVAVCEVNFSDCLKSLGFSTPSAAKEAQAQA